MSTRSSAAPRRAESPDVSPVATHFARSAILAAAVQVFTRRGIAATRVEDLLQAAAIARRTFYKYFASKEEVLAALYEVSTTAILKAIADAQQRDPTSPLAGIRAGIDVFLGFYRTSPRALSDLIEIAIRSDSLLAPRRRWVCAELVRILDVAVQALDGRKLDPLVYYALVSALEGLSIELAASGATARDSERARAVLHALVDHALGLPTPRPMPTRPGA